ncbi:MAG: tRNA lysidine(34) synthetase TilS, partial [Hyphomonadaceae bacterium]
MRQLVTDHFNCCDALCADASGPIGVAVSGGGDSMALLHMALQWRPATDFLVLTVDHGLRPEAKREAEFVKDFCLKAGAVHRTLLWTPPKGNISQARARDARHRMLATALREGGGSHLLLGHTLDDQYETVHMRAARGETGLAGMRALSVSPVWPEGRGIYLARPLLGTRRSDLRRLLRDASVDWVEDPSNANQNFERVRTRHVLAQETASGQDALDARLKAAD